MVTNLIKNDNYCQNLLVTRYTNGRFGIKFILNLEAVPKGRPIFTYRKAITPPKTRQFERAVKEHSLIMIREHAGALKHVLAIKETSAVKLKLIFNFEPSENEIKKGQIDYHIRTPDLDNLVKSIKDAFNDLFYKDDKQVCMILAEKNYAVENNIQIELIYCPIVKYKKKI